MNIAFVIGHVFLLGIIFMQIQARELSEMVLFAWFFWLLAHLVTFAIVREIRKNAKKKDVDG